MGQETKQYLLTGRNVFLAHYFKSSSMRKFIVAREEILSARKKLFRHYIKKTFSWHQKSLKITYFTNIHLTSSLIVIVTIRQTHRKN